MSAEPPDNVPSEFADVPVAAKSASPRCVVRRREARASLFGSLVLHAVGFGVAVAVGWWPGVSPGPSSQAAATTLVRPMEIEAADVPAVISPVPETLPIEDTLAPAALQELVLRELDKQVRRNESADVMLQQQRLEEQARRLERLSNSENVGAVGRQLASTLQLAPRATAPTQFDSPSFDFETAQLHDVRTEAGEGGEVVYVGVLVDAAGVSMETPLDAEDGKELSRVFGLMRKFPLLESVYRDVVMSLLDQMLASGTSGTGEKTGADGEPAPPSGPAQ